MHEEKVSAVIAHRVSVFSERSHRRDHDRDGLGAQGTGRSGILRPLWPTVISCAVSYFFRMGFSFWRARFD